MSPLLTHKFTPRILATFLIEVLFTFVAVGVLLHTRSLTWDTWSGLASHKGLNLLYVLSVTAAFQFALWSFGLYSRQVIYSGDRMFRRLWGAFALGGCLIITVCYGYSLTGYPEFQPTVKYCGLVIVALFSAVYLERALISRLFRGVSHFGNVLILGANDCTKEFIREARKHHGDSLHVAAILAEAPVEPGASIDGIPVIGDLSLTESVVKSHRIKTIVICAPYGAPNLPIDFLVESKVLGKTVIDASVLYEMLGQKLLLEKLDPFSFLFPEGFSVKLLKRLTKTLFEKALALTLLVIFAIPGLLVALAIKLTSPGPVIYNQQRVGRGGRVFTLYKFRTMSVDAEKGRGAVWCTPGDPRVTTVGKWLRRTRIDELPQLINVLKGDMAFVGPRPERPEFVRELEQTIPYYRHRHFVKPGLSGWAQVAFAYASSVDDSREKLRYDLYYVKHLSLAFDLLILLSTFTAVAKGQGVR